MAKPIQFKSTRTASGWAVNVPPKLSDSGKRQRRFFDTKREADGFLDDLKTRIENHGIGARLLAPWQEQQAAKAFELLASKNIEVQLSEIVGEFIERRAKRAASEKFKDAFLEFETADTMRRSDSYKKSLRQFRVRLDSLGDKMLCDIRAADLDKAMRMFPASVYNFGLRILGGVFNYGMKKEWCDQNPVERLGRKVRPPTEVQIYTPAQAAALMAAADERIVPMLAVCMFAGLRASEARKTTWGDIDLAEGVVKVRATVAKTHRPRTIPISANLKAWLQPHVGKAEASIVPTADITIVRLLRAAHEDAKVPRIKHGARHSFASYLLARDGSIDDLVLAMGHDDVKTTFQHYHRAATKKDAVAFWKIAPAKRSANVVEMPKPKPARPARKAKGKKRGAA